MTAQPLLLPDPPRHDEHRPDEHRHGGHRQVQPGDQLGEDQRQESLGRDLPPLRLVAAPGTEPPYDDEVPPEQRTWPPRVPAQAGPGLRLLAPAGDRQRPHVPRAAAGAVPSWPAAAPEGLPPARAAAQALVVRLLEVMAGVRPVGHLSGDLSWPVYEQLERDLARVAAARRRGGSRPDLRAVRSVHALAVAEGVVEVCATVRREGAARALALRLVAGEGRWRCDALEGV